MVDWGMLRSGALRRLLGGEIATVTAVYGLSLAGTVIVEEATHSSAGIGLVFASSILPAFLFSLVAGAAVDRWGRKRLLLAAHVARAVIGIAFWVATGLLSGGTALVAVYLCNAMTAASSQFAAPAEQAMLPDVVPAPRLATANVLYQVGMIAGEGLGILLVAPIVVKASGAPAVGLSVAILCGTALVLAAGLPASTPALAPGSEPGMSARSSPRLAARWHALRDDVRAGWQAIAADRVLMAVAVQATVAGALLLVLLALLPGLVSRRLGMAVEDAPYLVLPGGAGFLLGAALVGRLGNRLDLVRVVPASLATAGVSAALLGLVAGPGWRVVAAAGTIALLGFGLAGVVIPARVTLQRRPPPVLRGRVIAAQLALANASAVLPLILGGAVADWVGIRPVMIAVGVVAVVGALSFLPLCKGERREA
ncbi:MAG: MFS transporter [Anaerolineae bacterium]|nr:MFS transporter [Anaerolineae bacterium]